MSQVKYRLAFEAVEGKWVVRERTGDNDLWGLVIGRYDSLSEAEDVIAAHAHQPAERLYDEHGRLVELRVPL
jgi:hypothetical protein